VCARRKARKCGVTAARAAVAGFMSLQGSFQKRGGAPHDAHLLRRSRDAVTACHVSRAGRTLWAHDGSPAPAGPRRAHHGPGGYCQPSKNQGVLGLASVTLNTWRENFAKYQDYKPGEPARQNRLAGAWGGSWRPVEPLICCPLSREAFPEGKSTQNPPQGVPAHARVPSL
jgi:hypothetical protein